MGSSAHCELIKADRVETTAHLAVMPAAMANANVAFCLNAQCMNGASGTELSLHDGDVWRLNINQPAFDNSTAVTYSLDNPCGNREARTAQIAF